jgi:regulator of replication initiation timing
MNSSSDTRNQEQQIKQLFINQQQFQQNFEKLINSLQQENHKLRLDNAELQEKLRQNNKTHQSRMHSSQQPRHDYNEQQHYAKLIQEKDAEISALKKYNTYIIIIIQCKCTCIIIMYM